MINPFQIMLHTIRNSIACLASIGFVAVWICASGCGPFRSQVVEGNPKTTKPGANSVLVSLRDLLPRKQPSHDRHWRPDLAILPYVEFNDDLITIRNARDCRYRSEDDYDVRHYDLSFRLDEVRSADFIVVPFQNAPSLAHTMLSFGLRDGRHFVVSVEARLEQGESYSPTKGSQDEFELMYVVGSERDLIALRTEVRKVDVYLYRASANPDQVQDLLVDILARVNGIARKPEFYGTLTNNCTTNIVRHVNRLRPGRIPLDPRILLPGHSDQLAFELGMIEFQGDFAELKARSKINTLAHLYHDDPDFSGKIRQH
jgi:Domain of unknown function (DUF4105)